MTLTNQDIITLKSKLTSPRLTNTIRRSRLDVLFNQVKETQLTAVTAGAGHGKSTAVAQACRQLGLKTVWYRLDASDQDLLVMVCYLIAGLRQHESLFGQRILDRIQSAGQSRLDPYSLLTLLAHDFEQKIQGRLVIVLDDFHLVQERCEICEAMEFLLENLFKQIHWVLISRTDLKIDIARRVAARQVFSITEKELAFTRKEIRQLYDQVFQRKLLHRHIENLARETGGWAAGLVLCHYAASDDKADDLSKRLSLLKGNHQLFKAYLENNVFNHLNAEQKDFLIQTAILPSMEVDFCNRLLGIENAGETLRLLEKKYLFTFALDEVGETFHYHHLFKSFLTAKLKETFDSSALKGIFRRAAQLWEEQGVCHESVACYLSARAYDAAARVLVENGQDMIARGRVGQMIFFCRQFPGSFLNQMPELQYLMGICLLFQGHSQQALEVFQTARRIFESRSDSNGVGLCLLQIAAIHALRCDVIRSEKIYLEVIAAAKRLSEPYLSALSSLIYTYSRMGKLSEADTYYNKAQEIMDDVGDTYWPALFYVHYGFRFLASEDYDRTIHYAQKAVDIAERFKAYFVVVPACHLISNSLRELGKHDQAFEAALEGIRFSETYGFMEASYAWCLLNAGMAEAGQQEFSEALDYCEKSLALCIRTESDWSEAWCQICISYIQSRLGNMTAVETAGRKAFAAIERTTFEPDRNVIRIALAWGLLGNRRLAEAKAMIPSADEMPPYSKKMILWIRLFKVAWNRRAGRMEAAKAGLLKILQEVQRNYRPQIMQLMAEYQTSILGLLKQIYLEGDYRPEISRLIPYLKEYNWEKGVAFLSPGEYQEIVDAKRFLLTINTNNAVESLRICCFGAFELLQGRVSIASDTWVNLKARTLFKYLAYNSSNGYISKEQLLEAIWPEQDPAKTINRFHVALSAIRKMLQPQLARGQDSAYLLRREDSYRLNPGPEGYLDVTEFDDTLQRAKNTHDSERALALMREAEAVYRGHLFDDEPYTQWCLDARDIYMEKFTALLSQIADHYQEAGKTARSIDYLQRALEIDPYAEPLYCRLMDLYQRHGNRFMALKTYERCRSKLEKELQCPLSKETKQTYRRLVAN